MAAATTTTPTTTPAAIPATFGFEPELDDESEADEGVSVTTTVLPGPTLVTTDGAAVVDVGSLVVVEPP